MRSYLVVLVGAGLVVLEDGDRGNEVVCFLVEDAHLWDDERTRLLYGHPRTRQVATHVVQLEPCSTSTLAEALDKRQATVRYHLRKLKARDLVIPRQVGRKFRYRAAEMLVKWWEEVVDREGER